MPQSIFAANGTQLIDAIDPTYAPSGIWNLGVVYIGGSKSAVRRCLGRFDVFGAPASGRPLTIADTLIAAELILETTSVAGPSAWPARIERITRADWDYTTANWTRYKTGSNWTTAGGDVGTPPSALAFTSPTVGGEFVISGLLPYVTDAVISRGGHVLIRLKADDEQPAQSQWCAFEAFLASSLRPRLRVTYEATDPTPIDHPGDVMVGKERGDAAGRAQQPASHAKPARADSPRHKAATLVPNP